LVIRIKVSTFKYKEKIKNMNKKVKATPFQIIPVTHPTLGIVYQLNSGNTVHGTFGNMNAAVKRKLELVRQLEETQIIQESEEMEFEIEL